MEFENIFKKEICTRVQFYSLPPIHSLSLEQLRTLAIDRLKVLRDIEFVAQDYIKGCKDYDDKLRTILNKSSSFSKSLISYNENVSVKQIKEEIRNDIASHFILQIVYCKTEDLSRWFISQEIDLFKYRFKLEKLKHPEFIPQFIRDNNIKINPASESDMNLNQEHCETEFTNEIFYKVSMILVQELVNKRQVHIENGMAYLYESELLTLISVHFRENLSHSLSFMRLTLPQIYEDGRLMPILSDLDKCFIGKDYSVEPSMKITATQVPLLSKKSFPPCMQKVQSVLARDHHLKHWARMQYGLFLKGIGLPLEESLKFWQSSFEPVTNTEVFARRYAYSIRHNYGQEGKRVSYTPYSCQKIITGNPPQSGDCHGCPFQQSGDVELIVQGLRNSTRATPQQLDEIVTKARQRHYQISCRNYFRLVHGLPDDYSVAINHPNEYFEESQKVLGATSQPKTG